LRVVVCLGGFAWQALWPVLAQAGYPAPRPRPAFRHGAEAEVRSGNGVQSGDEGRLLVLGCFHPSQQNTFTGRVTGDMVDAVLIRARACAAAGRGKPAT
jgi:uracil-DNA glycosylase